jgi:hypothetical protein
MLLQIFVTSISRTHAAELWSGMDRVPCLPAGVIRPGTPQFIQPFFLWSGGFISLRLRLGIGSETLVLALLDCSVGRAVAGPGKPPKWPSNRRSSPTHTGREAVSIDFLSVLLFVSRSITAFSLVGHRREDLGAEARASASLFLSATPASVQCCTQCLLGISLFPSP